MGTMSNGYSPFEIIYEYLTEPTADGFVPHNASMTLCSEAPFGSVGTWKIMEVSFLEIRLFNSLFEASQCNWLFLH